MNAVSGAICTESRREDNLDLTLIFVFSLTNYVAQRPGGRGSRRSRPDQILAGYAASEAGTCVRSSSVQRHGLPCV